MSTLLDRQISEAAFQKQVIHLARLRGWRVFHARAAMNARGRYMTPVAADGAGFPDLVLTRDRVIFAELKSETGRTSYQQDAWLAALKRAGAETHIWRPRDWKAIQEALQ